MAVFPDHLYRAVAVGGAALTVLAAASACGGGDSVRTVRGDRLRLTAADSASVATADTGFGLRLLDAWCRSAPTSDLVFSPSSLATGLGMAYLAARGSTAAAIGGVLGVRPETALAVAAGRSKELDAIPGVERSDQVWADGSLKTEPTYLNQVTTGYGAGLNLVPLLKDPERARGAINGSISRATHGRIHELLPAGSLSGSGWVLTDATYLKADWAEPFKHDDTYPDTFTSATGATVRPDFMHRAGEYQVATAQGWTAVELPYAKGSLSALALLPDQTTGGGCPGLTPATLAALRGGLSGDRVDLSLPKVTTSGNTDLSALLGKLGMGPAFASSADFTGLSPQATALGFVRHAAWLKVDEAGTEAAAATGAGIGAGAVRPQKVRQISFNRPYLLIIQDTQTGEPLFISRIADPTQ